MANQKVTALGAIAAATDDDLIYLVDDPLGIPVSKKITFDNFQKSITDVGNITTGTWSAAFPADSIDADALNFGTGFGEISAVDIPIADAGGIITATDVEAALQENRTAIDLNTLKETNVTTDLSAGARTATTIKVDSSDGTDATLVEADTTNAGILGSDKWDEIVANSVHSGLVNEHIDWTNATDNFKTTGTLQADGWIGLGGGSPTVNTLVSVGSTRTVGNANVYSISSTDNVTITANQTGRHVGLNFDLTLTGDYDVSRSSGYGGIEGATFRTNYNGSGTVSKMTGFNFWATVDGGGTIENLMYIGMGNPGITDGSYTNVIGLYIGALTQGTNNYAIVLEGDNLGGGIILGAGQDSAIYYDGSDLVLDPKIVGTGTVDIKVAPTTGETANKLGCLATTAYFIIELEGVAYKVPCLAA